MDSIEFEDITDLLNDVANGTHQILFLTIDLLPGQMFHTESFSLYESMSAIEIYDPKMDLKSNLKDATTIDTAIKNEIIAPPEKLTNQEVFFKVQT